jgi:hypothetical protein
MATIVTRAGKGSALTFTEGDANFTNLNTDKIENVVEDLTPQLGGNLDVQGNTITTSVTNGNIAIEPNGTGIVSINKSTTLSAGNLTVSAGNISAPTILNVTNSHTAGAQFFMGQSHTTADANNIAFGRSRGTVTSQAAVQNADELFELVVVANDGSATTAAGSKLAWGITTTMTDDPSTNLLPHRTDFRVNTTVGAAETYMSVANDAVVRVRELGTTSDVTNLNISAGEDGNINLKPNGTGRVVIDGSDAEDSIGILEVGDIVNSGTDALVLISSAGLEFSAGSEGIEWRAETDDVLETYILVDPATGNIELTPQGTGKLFVDADTLRLGDANAAATITTNGTGNLVLNTNSGTNSGSITIAQGTNGAITVSPNGSGVTLLLGSTISTITPTTANNPALQARSTVTISDSETYPSLNVIKARSNLLLADMTNEPAVMNFVVRDSSNTNRTFGRWIGRYNGPSANPTFVLRGSPDGFTTNLTYMTLGGGVGIFGSASSNYTISSNTNSNLILTANNNTTSGTITIASGADANISIAPNGTGKVVLSTDVVNIAETKTPASATAAGVTGDIAWDADYIYVCTATDTWKRVAISTWA